MTKQKQHRIDRIEQRTKNPVKNNHPPGLRQRIKSGSITVKKALEIVLQDPAPSLNFIQWARNRK